MSYHERNRALREIGFDTYAEYLKSALWYDIQWRVFEKYGFECWLCHEGAECVHHNRYALEDLLGKDLSFMRPVCHDCHGRIEFDGGEHVGRKRTVEEAATEFAWREKNMPKRPCAVCHEQRAPTFTNDSERWCVRCMRTKASLDHDAHAQFLNNAASRCRNRIASAVYRLPQYDEALNDY